MNLLEVKFRNILNDGNSNTVKWVCYEGYWTTQTDLITGVTEHYFHRINIEYDGVLLRDYIPENVNDLTEWIIDLLIEEHNLTREDFVN